jgi:hypothetical protein
MDLLTSRRFTLDDPQAAQEFCHDRGWTDGLPVLAPTPDAVGACLAAARVAPGQQVGVEPVRNRVIAAEKVAVNAVMAGCAPTHFPLVLAALTAMLAEPFLLHGATSSTGGAAVLLIVNGGGGLDAGLDGTFNALGPSDRGSTCVGRAVNLVLRNLLDVRPGDVDRSTLGHPGKISFCIVEDEEHSPWPSVAAERLGERGVFAVTAMAAMAPRQVMNEWTTDPVEILDTYVSEIRSNMAHYSIWPGNYAIVVPPQLREHFVAAGWSKADIRRYVFEHARIHRRQWADCGKARIVGDKGDLQYAALPDEDHLLVIAAGVRRGDSALSSPRGWDTSPEP